MAQNPRRWRRMAQNPDLASQLDKIVLFQRWEKMEEDGTEPRPGIIVGQDSSMTKMGEDGGGCHRTQPGVIVGQDSSMTKGEDGGGCHRTQPGVIVGQDKDGRDATEPNLA